MREQKYDISFLAEDRINNILESAKEKAKNKDEVEKIIKKASLAEGITPEEAAILLNIEDKELLDKMFKVAKQVKEKIYGKRIVMFAPLYVSNYCVNDCVYCGYQHCNEDLNRKKLTREELVNEVKALEKLGHKRIVLEAGEDPINCSLDYILQCIKDIYSIKFENGNIRRININIAATTVENYKKLKEAEIGTYTLFQESFHKPTYEKLHLAGPKKDYYYHTTAMFRAREAGIDDVGIGVLYGLYEHKYETVAMILYANELEKVTGVGGYSEANENTAQFEVGDHRSPMEMLASLINSGYIPSYCTACYRSGRTGDRFMEIAKSGKINVMCEANALMTLKEFLLDYADENLRELGSKAILEALEKMTDENFKNKIKGFLKDIENGARDISV